MLTSENDGVIMYVLYRKGDVINILAYMVCAAVVLYSTICDVRSFKVSNYVVVTGWMSALVIRLVNEGVTGLITWSQGAALLFAVVLPVYIVGAIGGADVKMFSVIGAYLGINVGITVVIIAFIVGALISLTKMILQGTLVGRVRYFVEYIRNCILSCEIMKYETGYDGGSVIHFMLPIMIAVICVAGIV